MHLLVATLLLVFSLSAQASDTTKTGGLMNGRVWKAMPEHIKGMYLGGMRDGRMLSGIAAAGADAPQKVLDAIDHQEAEGIIGDDIVKAFDKFYSEPANIRIPL